MVNSKQDGQNIISAIEKNLSGKYAVSFEQLDQAFDSIGEAVLWFSTLNGKNITYSVNLKKRHYQFFPAKKNIIKQAYEKPHFTNTANPIDFPKR